MAVSTRPYRELADPKYLPDGLKTDNRTATEILEQDWLPGDQMAETLVRQYREMDGKTDEEILELFIEFY